MLNKTPPEGRWPFPQGSLEKMSINDLWNTREQVRAELGNRITADITRLQQMQARLNLPHTPGKRPYPPVKPKYRNPDSPGQTWAGRGKEPRWLRGKNRDDCLIPA